MYATHDSLADLKLQFSLPYFKSRIRGIKPSGQSWSARCVMPSHSDNKASLSVFLDKGIWKFRCHGCNAAGDVLDLIEQVQHVDFTEADRIFREFCGDMKPGTPPPPAPINTPIKRPQVSDEQIAAWQKALSEECRDPFSAAGNYLHRRGIAPEIAERLSWGFDTRSESIVIPRFHGGELVGVKFRKIEPTDDVKWTQVKGSSKCDFLYGCGDIMDPFADLLFIAEGEHEKALLNSLGVEAVAILGTAGVPDQATSDFIADLKWVTDTFSRVLLIPDSDPSGQQAMERLQKMLADFPVTVATLPGFKDFGDFYQADSVRAVAWLEGVKQEAGDRLAESIVESLVSSVIEPETYPLDAWEGTEYAEFARRCAVGEPYFAGVFR